MVDKQLRRNFFKLRSSVEVERILTLDGHDVALAHFKLNKTLSRIVFNYISYIKENLLRAIAVRLDMLESP